MKMKIWLLVWGCALASQLVHSEEQALSLLSSVAINKVQQIAMAPNGKHVAFIQTNTRNLLTESDGPAWSELYIVNQQGQRKPFVTGQVHVHQVAWSTDSQTLWFLGHKPTDSHFSLYAMSVSGGEAHRVYQHSTPILGFALSPDTQSLAFWAKEIEDKKNEQLKQKGFNAIVFEETLNSNQLWQLSLTKPSRPERIFTNGHVLSANYFNDGKHLLISVSASSLEDDVLAPTLVKTNLSGKSIAQFKHEGKIENVSINDKNQVAFIGGIDKSDPKAGQLFLLDEHFQQAQLLLTDFPGHIQAITWLNNKKIGFIAHQGTQAFWAEKQVSQPGPDFKIRLKKNEIFEQVSIDKQARQMAFISHSSRHASEAFWFTNKQYVQVSHANPQLDTTGLPKQETLTFKAQDGTQLEGIYVHPLTKQDDNPPPVILFIHGGPQAHFSNGWMSRYSHPAYYAASLGFASFFPNYRGSTGRGVAFSQLGQGDLAGQEFTDLLDAKAFLVEEGLADSNRIGITGSSYGGYAAAWAATAQSKHFAASVMFAGISNQISKFGTTDIPQTLYQTQTKKWPWEQWDYLLERSPINYVEQHRTPLLIVHGNMDARVHPGQALELYRHLKIKSQAPVRLVLYPDEGHGNVRLAAQLDYAHRLLRWMTHFVINQQTRLPENTPPDVTSARS